MKTEFNKTEMKTARNLLAEVASSTYSHFYSDEKIKVEVALTAMDVINNWQAPNSSGIYFTKFSNLSYDAMAMARGMATNFHEYFEGDDLFAVTTTHDMDSFAFSNSAISHLAIYLLKKVFVNENRLERIESCNFLAGSKYRPAQRKLAEKILALNAATNNNAAEVENILDEIRGGEIAIDSIESRIEKLAEEFNEVKDTAEQTKAKEIQFLLECANEEIDFAKKRIKDAMKEIDGKNISGALVEVAGMIERIEYAEETADRANSILAEIEEVNAMTATTEIKKFEVGKWYYDLFDSAKRPAYKVTRRTKKMVTLIDDFGEIIKRKISIDLGVEEIHIGGIDSLDETALKATAFCTNAEEIQKAEDDLAYSLGQDAEVEEINAEKNSLKEKVAEIKNRPRKSAIDWADAIFQNVTLPEIFQAQKFLRKYLKLGQLDLAENVFAMLKTLCKNYRVA